MKTYEIEFTFAVVIEVDPALLDISSQPEFREKLYEFDTLEDWARHIAWNKAVKRFSHVEGLGDDEEDLYKIIDTDWL